MSVAKDMIFEQMRKNEIEAMGEDTAEMMDRKGELQ